MNLLDQSNQNDQIDPNKDYYAELTGPGGKFDRSKYTSDEDMHKAMARGKVEADRFIEFKNREFDELKTSYLDVDQKYKASASLQEIIDQIKNDRQNNTNDEQNLNVNEVLNKPALSQEDVDNLIQSRLTERERQRKEEDNYRIVEAKLKEQLGVNYASILKQQANDLGLTDEEVNSLARRAPQAFFKTFEVEGQTREDSFQTPPRNQRTDHFAPNTNNRTWSYYEKLRRDKPQEYLSGKTQSQMHKDMTELGEAFKDGNYKNLERL